MRRAFLVGWAALVALGFVSGGIANSAAANQANASATLSYLRAGYRYLGTVQANLAVSHAAIDALEHSVATECPGVLGNAPKGHGLDEFRKEIYWTSIVVEAEPDRRATERRDRAITRLQWRNHRLTKLVRSEADASEALELHRPPHLCSDATAWAESDYRTLPGTSVAFLEVARRSEAAEDSGKADMEKLLKRYEGRRAARLAQRLEKRELKLGLPLLQSLTDTDSKLEADLGVRKAESSESVKAFGFVMTGPGVFGLS